MLVLALLITAYVVYSGGDDDSPASVAASPSVTSNPAQVPDGKPLKPISITSIALTGGKPGSATCGYVKSADQGAPAGLGTPPAKAAKTGTVQATVTTNLGVIAMDLDATTAPCTTNSFAFLASKKFYDKSSCHRLTTAGLQVLQCGDPTGTGMGGPGYRYANENIRGMTHMKQYKRGVLAMANSQQKDSNGSQFFIVHNDSDLPDNYTIFGKVTSGMEIVDQVAKAGATTP